MSGMVPCEWLTAQSEREREGWGEQDRSLCGGPTAALLFNLGDENYHSCQSGGVYWERVDREGELCNLCAWSFRERQAAYWLKKSYMSYWSDQPRLCCMTVDRLGWREWCWQVLIEDFTTIFADTKKLIVIAKLVWIESGIAVCQECLSDTPHHKEVGRQIALYSALSRNGGSSRTPPKTQTVPMTWSICKRKIERNTVVWLPFYFEIVEHKIPDSSHLTKLPT